MIGNILLIVCLLCACARKAPARCRARQTLAPSTTLSGRAK